MLKREKEVFQNLFDKEEDIIKALEKHYRDALHDINMSIRIMQSDELTQSKVYQLEYQKALKKQVEGILERMHAKEYTTIQQYLSDSYKDAFVGTMYSMHGQGIPIIAAIDQNAAVKAVITDSAIREGLYEHLAVGVDGMKKAIRQELTRGIASNMRYADIARNIESTTKAPLANAKNIVRTEGHRIQQASAHDARKVSQSKGADVVKQWDATLDGATRRIHRELDGKIVEVDEPFVVGNNKALYPGDFGDASLDCQCRCVALTRARWALDEAELETLKERAAYFKLDKTEDFQDFKNKYLKAAEEEKQGTADVRIETRKQAIEAIENCGFNLVGHGVEYMPDDQVIVAATRLKELESRFGCAKDGNYTLEAPVFGEKDKNTFARTTKTKTTGSVVQLNAEYYSKSVGTLVKTEKIQIARGYNMPCAEEHIKHYTVTHEYGHMLEAMVFEKRHGVSLNELDREKRKMLLPKFEKDVWNEIRGIAKENNTDFKITKSVISEYGRTNYAEAFAETFANALCGKPNELGEAMAIWLERNGF